MEGTMEKKRITQRTITVDGREIAYQLERKRVKNLNLRVRRDGSVYVSAAGFVPQAEIEAFLIQKGQYILRAIDYAAGLERPRPKRFVSGETFVILGRELCLQVLQGTAEGVSSDGAVLYLRVKDTDDFPRKQRLMAKYLDQRCRAIFTEILEESYPPFQKYGVAMPALRIRDMTSRWGSCLKSKGVVTLSKRLLAAPRGCMEYVVVHELCHLVHPNHSKQFYGLLAAQMPDWRERKAALDKVPL